MSSVAGSLNGAAGASAVQAKAANRESAYLMGRLTLNVLLSFGMKPMVLSPTYNKRVVVRTP